MTEPEDQPGDQLASVAQRAIARAVDLVVVAVITLAVFAPKVTASDGTDDEISGWTQLTMFAIWVLYEAGTTAVLGRTMGKMATGCQVSDRRTGQRPGIARSVVRAAVVPGLLPFLNAFALLAYPTALLDTKERRGLLDRLSGTVITRVA